MLHEGKYYAGLAYKTFYAFYGGKYWTWLIPQESEKNKEIMKNALKYPIAKDAYNKLTLTLKKQKI